jgi:prepilin-type N-terminal cleavage/methylation domain-containing protein
MKLCRNFGLTKQRGFTLLEMMISLLILGIVTGAVFSQLNLAQERMTAEQTKLDDFQQARDFVDQFFRDINEIGYPNTRMTDTTSALWAPPLTTQGTYAWASPYISDNRFAMGLVKIDANTIQFEADANGDGIVQSVVYTINGSGTCALCLQRSQVNKLTANPLTGQAPNWGTEVNDVLSNPIFKYYDANGNQIPPASLPLDISTAAGAQTIANIKTIQISLRIQNPAKIDMQNGLPIESVFEGEVSLNNCSMAFAGQAMSCQ